MTDGDTVALESSWVTLALGLFGGGTVPETRQQIVDLAVQAVEGCDAAGVFTVGSDKVVTAAWSEPFVAELDAMQFDSDEGPCLDALSGGGPFWAEDLADDPRWPVFGPVAARAGMRSIVAFPLSVRMPSALSLYARRPSAFAEKDRARGPIFATLSGIALGAAQERASDDERFGNLQDALQSRELIGQAQGILMERKRITAAQAFAVLRSASQHQNRKLRDVAETVVTTGTIPAPASSRTV